MKLWKSKTFWTAIVGILTSVVAFATQEITFAEFVTGFIGSLVFIFIRDGIDQNIHAFFGKWKFWTSKTFWGIVAAILAAFGSYIGGAIDLMGLVAAILAALSMLFVRSAVNPETP